MPACRTLAALLLAVALGACSYPRTGSIDGLLPAQGPLIPDTTFNIGPTTTIRLESLLYWGAAAAAAYYILDPLAPNWEIQEARHANDHVQLALKMKRYHNGGDGEARAVFQRRARELGRADGFDGYEVVEYAESLDSSLLGSQRMAGGVIRLKRKAG